MKRIAILGSTGSIGLNALGVIRHLPNEFKVVGLSTNCNVGILSKQINEFRPKVACINDHAAVMGMASSVKSRTRIVTGSQGLREIIQTEEVDLVLIAISGSSALAPLLEAIEAGKTIALANKEALVMAGHLIMEQARKRNVKILPIDSEQSAIWQCLEHADRDKLKQIYLTASGGPFVNVDRKALKDICVSKAVRHPRWKMGRKISVDSATMMNKGLEILEAMALFDVGIDKIKVLIHREAIIHSMVEFVDGVVMAQLSATDMRIPIQYALTYPDRLKANIASIDFAKIGSLHFQRPDLKKFPCLGLAISAATKGGTMPAVLNAANEVSVNEFLRGRLKFTLIPTVISRVLDDHSNNKNATFKNILAADEWARRRATFIIERLNV